MYNRRRGSTTEVKTGVYVCHCGLNIAGTVDVKKVAEYARGLDWVVVARDYEFMCSDPGQALIKNDIKEFGLNRVVVASCSPRMHEATFRRVCQEAGLNPYLFEQANIREQCSWVHSDKHEATEKAKALVRAAVRRVYYHELLEIKEIPVNPNTLVVGGGIAGIQAALDIADSEHKVYLVEREPSIGGHMIQLDTTFPTLDCSECILTPKMTLAGSHPYIELMAYSEVEEVSGYIGNYKVKIRKRARYVDADKCNGCGMCQEKCPWKVDSEFNLGLGKRKAIYTPFPQAVPNIPVIDTEHCAYFLKGACRVCERVCELKAINFEQKDEIVEVEVGAIILATGYDSFDARLKPEYGYGLYPNVITGLELERLLSAAGPTQGVVQINGKVPKNVVFIQCVGSRDKTVGNEYCSRVCCMYTAKHAHSIKEKIPDAKVTIFYMDIRAFGKGCEQFYERVQKERVLYRRGSVSEIYKKGDKLVVRAEDTLQGELIEEEADLVVLAVGLAPRKDANEVMRMFNISPDLDGFFLERHIKLDPIATATEGVFIVGCCQGPKDIPDTVAQASAGAAKVLALISKGRVTLEATTAKVNETLCQGCGRCEEICEFHAPKVCRNEAGLLVSTVNEALCKGCGVCAVACPTGAISIRHFTRDEILSMVDALVEV
ncbi:4Fe-4S binding protein [Chloroflexota bacterium]